MKIHAWLMIGTGLLVCLLQAATGATNAAPTVKIELRDGCIIVGTFKANALSFESDTLGKMQMPLERLEKVAIPQGETAALITFWNKDSLKARLTEKELVLQTAFGELKIPAAHIAEMKFSAPASKPE